MSSLSAFVSISEEMLLVKAAWDLAPTGAKRDAALVHLHAAERSLIAHEDAECLRALSAVIATLQ